MSLDFSFSCPLPNGVHARPASALEEVARGFSSEVTLLNQRTGQSANAKSILSLVGADIRFSDPCLLKVAGMDEQRAMAVLGSFIRNTLPRQEATVPATPAADGEWRVPPCLARSGTTLRRGVPMVPGIAHGAIVRVAGFTLPDGLATDGVQDVEKEQQRIARGLEELIEWYSRRAAIAGRTVETELLIAHRAFARDEEFRACLFEAVAKRRRTAAGAIADAESHFSQLFWASDNPLLRERALDIKDVCSQLLQRVYVSAVAHRSLTLSQDSIVVADALTPCQFLALDPCLVRGLVLAETGTTSHTVILARSFGIPTLTNVERVDASLADHCEAVLDADLGVLVTKLTHTARRYYAMERERLDGREAVLRGFSVRPARTLDGHPIEMAANIATVEEAERAFVSGAEGIGLFRTEMLFLDRVSPPDEAEQFQIYHRVLETADGRPVIIRTMDIGGDKPLAYLNLALEQNPFLGYRAVRMYPGFEDLFRTQIRALVRASAHGPLRVMIPMVAAMEEVLWVKQVISEEQERCLAEGKRFDREMRLGVMLEVPSSAFIIQDLSEQVDFFSIGSNDLLQYFMAVDRTNAQVATLYNPLQPAFLRLLNEIASKARAHGKWIGLCGEMGGLKRALPLLVGLGINEVSVSAPFIAGLKAELARFEKSECERLLAEALRCRTVAEVTALLEDFFVQHSAPLLAEDLVVVDVDALTKEEAIKRAVDLLYITGRTEQPRALEAAVWERENSYSTGFGHGFAIPHCKTTSIQANSLVLLRLRQPVEWGSTDDKPVQTLMLIVIRDLDGASAHMKIISSLARQIMHEEFRQSIEQAPDAAALCAVLNGRLPRA
ncbi:MAG TPA: phosphoenolpyruvate--protein phosphotransferase [Verrucomicrobiae bacterium]|nr:phosphoenolpyruvate--protein phosphotransferase [Verrucomicrobiae bacterium]